MATVAPCSLLRLGILLFSEPGRGQGGAFALAAAWTEAGAAAYRRSQIELYKAASQPITPKIPGLKAQLIAHPTTGSPAKQGPPAATKPGGQQIEKIDPRLE